MTENVVIIPNSKLSQSTVVNTYLPNKEMVITVESGVAYNSDLNKVEQVTLQAAEQIQANIPGAVNSFKPTIRFHTFADSNINFTVYLKIHDFSTKLLVVHEFIKLLKTSFDKEGIEISYPIRNLYYRSLPEANMPKLVKLKKGK